MPFIWAIIALLTAISAYRPGISVSKTSTPTPRSSPTDTGTWFVTGLADAGPVTPQLLRSMVDWARIFGQRVAYCATLYDAVDLFFNEGGAEVWVARVVGPGAVTASLNLVDGVPTTSLVAKAKGPGAGTTPNTGNFLKVAVLAGVVSGYRIQVTDATNAVLETSPDLATQQEAVNWSLTSQYINITIGASAVVPVPAAAASLAGGSDDRGSIGDTQWANALALFTNDYGPGQVSAPGRTTDTGHTQLVSHSDSHNRVAILDLPDTATAATLENSVVASRSAIPGAAFAPWLQGPGIVAGLLRTIPPSGFIAALCARNDRAFNPNQPGAGDLGQARWVTGLSQVAWDDATRDAMNKLGVNVIRSMFGGIRNYGWRSIVDSAAHPDWVDFGSVRLAMAIAAQADVIAEQFIFSVLDGAGTDIGHFNAALTAMLQTFWQEGALYGASSNDAFYVDTSAAVNTPTTIAANELHAVLNVRMSPMAEFVQINVVKVPITEAV